MKNTTHPNDRVEEYRTLLLKGLKEVSWEDSLKKSVAYTDAAKAFPRGPHTKNFEIQAIDTKCLKEWANDNGYEVSFDNTVKDCPPVIFRRKASLQ